MSTKINYDVGKSPLEISVEKAVNILERTHPEQPTDAMSDYSNALLALRDTTDVRVVPIKIALKNLYVYPTRKEHNKFIKDIHYLREELREDRIDGILEIQRQKELGEETSSKTTKKPLLFFVALFAIIAIYVYTQEAA